MVTVREKVITQKVRKQVKDPRRYSDTMHTTSRTNHVKSDSNFIKIPAEKASTAINIRSSKLVVTAAQIKSHKCTLCEWPTRKRGRYGNSTLIVSLSILTADCF